MPRAAKMLAYSIADDARAEHGHRLRHAGQLQDRLRVEDGLAVERHVVGAVRARAGGDHEELGGEGPGVGAARRLHRDRVGAGEARVALDDLDRVAPERLVDQLELALDDRALAVHEVGHRELGADLVADAVEAVAGELVEEDGALAQRLRGDRAPVDAVAAHHVGALDDRHGLSGAAPPGWPPAPPRGRSPGPRRRSAPSAPRRKRHSSGSERRPADRRAGRGRLAALMHTDPFVPAAGLGPALRGPAALDRRPAPRRAALLGVQPPQARACAPSWARRCSSSTCAPAPRRSSTPPATTCPSSCSWGASS